MNNLCIYCAANPDVPNQYISLGKKIAKELVKQKIQLIYGGATTGIMGTIAHSMIKLGGKVIGIVPDFLLKKEIKYLNLTELNVVSSIQQRKSLMIKMADTFAVLPGGIGTLDEAFETWVQVQIGLHNKPIGFLNINGYYNFLIKFLNKITKENFIYDTHRSMVFFEKDFISLIEKLSKKNNHYIS